MEDKDIIKTKKHIKNSKDISNNEISDKKILDAIHSLKQKMGDLVIVSYLAVELDISLGKLLERLKRLHSEDKLLLLKDDSFVKLNPYRKNSKDEIIGDFIAVRIKQPNTEEPSLLFCDKIGYMGDRDQFPKGSFDHHIMAYKDGNLILKVWLPNAATDKEFDGIREALESVGMEADI